MITMRYLKILKCGCKETIYEFHSGKTMRAVIHLCKPAVVKGVRK